MMNPLRYLVAGCMAAGLAGSALAQDLPPQQQAPNMPGPRATIPEKVDPPLRDPSSTGTTGSSGTLSDKLEQSEGVIRPPSDIAPDMTVPAPVPNPGTTPVIPPPGSPGGTQSVQPK
ncbi:hypothetical protein [Microvirga massiliensis]|uniref:hypothetical protein n=1 Tax=Microvirga massiliensis TaxID=1033741 RepID=UPI001FCD24B3|nr:hypothetical protein [Microvirga massiliensis]